MAKSSKFGEFLRNRRIARGLTLRAFCNKTRQDPGNISKLERGILAPPQLRERLESYARSLKIAKGSNEWQTFFDLAATGSGRIPGDLLKTPRVAEVLPAVFRALRGGKLKGPDKDALARLLKSR